MRVLGLDIASTTGFSVMDSPQNLITYGVIKLKSKDSYSRRFKIFRIEVLKLIETYKPDVVVIESTLIMGGKKNFTTGNTIAYLNNLRGIAIELVPESISLISVNSRTARKAVLRSGKLSKEEVFHLIVKIFKLKDFQFKKCNDITDAILLSWFGLMSSSV